MGIFDNDKDGFEKGFNKLSRNFRAGNNPHLKMQKAGTVQRFFFQHQPVAKPTRQFVISQWSFFSVTRTSAQKLTENAFLPGQGEFISMLTIWCWISG